MGRFVNYLWSACTRHLSIPCGPAVVSVVLPLRERRPHGYVSADL